MPHKPTKHVSSGDLCFNIIKLPPLQEPMACHLHPSIPQGSCLIVAPSCSGKTTLLVNLLLRRVFGVLVHYSQIHIFSPTCQTDESWDMIQPEQYTPFRIKCDDGKKRMTARIELHEEFDEGEIINIMDDQSARPREKRRNVLIILDDCAADFKDNVALSRLAMRGRHSRCFTWISTQMYRRIPRAVRTNIPYYIVFNTNQNETRTISEELATGSIHAFEAMLNKCTRRAFSFLGVNMKKPVDTRYSCNFNPIRIDNKVGGDSDSNTDQEGNE